MINKVRIKQRDNIITLITSLYTDYTISIITDTFMTSPIKVQRGVLQADSLLPLLFDLIVNTLINTIKSEKVECMGYVYNWCIVTKTLVPICGRYGGCYSFRTRQPTFM